MTLTARVRPFFYWLLGLNMVFIAITEWFSHGITGFSVTSIVFSLFAACYYIVEAVRSHLHPRPLTLTLSRAKLLIIVLVFISSSTIIAMAALTHFDTSASTVAKICFLFATLLPLLWLSAGSWLAFRYFCLWREKRRGPDQT